MSLGNRLSFEPAASGYGVWPSTPTRSVYERLEFFLAGTAVFLAPMNTLRHPSIYITLGDVFLVACLFVMAINRSLPLRPLGSGSVYWIVGVLLLIGGLFTSSILYGSPERGLIISGQYYVAFFIFPLVIVSRPWPQVVRLVQIFVLSIVLLCVHGIYLIHVDGQINTAFVSGTGRLQSFVERENALASLIALTTPLLLWLSATGCARPIVAWCALLLLIYGVMLTGSNTGLLGMAYGFAVFGLALFSWRRFAVALGSVIVILSAISLWGTEILPAVFQERVLSALGSGDIAKAGTFSHRYALIVEAQEIINNSLFMGVGADQHRAASQWDDPVHNAYLLIWSEGGVVALVGLFLILVGGGQTILSVAGRPGARLAAVCTFSSVTSFALLVNAVPHFYGRFWIVPVLLALAVSVAFEREGPVPTGFCKSASARAAV